MLVWDWVWGIQHWQKSLSLALSQSLCGVHSSIISSTLEYTTDDKSGQESRLTFKRSTIASPETSTHNSCCHSHASVVPSQAYSPHRAKLHVNRKANCTLAQRHQKDNSICPTSSGELKPIQATQTSDSSHHFPIRLQNLQLNYWSSLLREQKPNVSVTLRCLQQLLLVFIRNQSSFQDWVGFNWTHSNTFDIEH